LQEVACDFSFFCLVCYTSIQIGTSWGFLTQDQLAVSKTHGISCLLPLWSGGGYIGPSLDTWQLHSYFSDLSQASALGPSLCVSSHSMFSW